MYAITAKLKGIKTYGGNFKNKQVVEKQKRRFEKKNEGIIFKLERVDKEHKDPVNTFKAVKGHIERGEL